MFIKKHTSNDLTLYFSTFETVCNYFSYERNLMQLSSILTYVCLDYLNTKQMYKDILTDIIVIRQHGNLVNLHLNKEK